MCTGHSLSCHPPLHSAAQSRSLCWSEGRHDVGRGSAGCVPFCAVHPVKPPCCRVDCGLLQALQDLLSTLWLFRAGGEAGGLRGQRCDSHRPQGGDGTDSSTHIGWAGSPVSRREQGRDGALSLLPSQPRSSGPDPTRHAHSLPLPSRSFQLRPPHCL